MDQEVESDGEGVRSTSLDPRLTSNPNVSYNAEMNVYQWLGDDGIALVWDESKRAEELTSRQQSIYCPAPSASSSTTPSPHDAVLSSKKRTSEADDDTNDDTIKPKKPRKPKPPRDVNTSLPSARLTSIYVTGIPLDAGVVEIEGFFAKCGIIMPDLATNQPKIKLYHDPDGKFKGDALVCYFKKESVELALTLLDETPLRLGNNEILKIQRAEFKERPDPPPLSPNSLKSHHADPQHPPSATTRTETAPNPRIPRPRKVDKKIIERQLMNLNKQLGWEEDSKASKLEEKWRRTVVLKHMFSPASIEEDPGLALDLKQDIQSECEKIGAVTSITLFDQHLEGVVMVRFGDQLVADACVKMMMGRIFDGRKVHASIYDGKVKYSASNSRETEQDEQQRLERYALWLEESTGDGMASKTVAPLSSLASITPPQFTDSHAATILDNPSTTFDEDTDHADNGSSAPSNAQLFTLKGESLNRVLIGEKDRDLDQEEFYFDE